MEYVWGLSGRIMWLPIKSHVDEHLRPQIDDAIYDQPVMRLSPRPDADGKVKVLIITSFRGKPFTEAHRTRERRACFLPIEPSGKHPDTQELLKFESGCLNMAKKSYINTSVVHEMHLGILDDHNDRFLDRASCFKAADACGYRPSIVQVSLDAPIKSKDLRNHRKAKKASKGVDTPAETGVQDKEPVQKVHPGFPRVGTEEDGLHSTDGDEGSGKFLTSVMGKVGDKGFVSSPIQENTGRVNVDLGATLPLDDEPLDVENDVQAALTLLASDDGIVGTGHRRSDVPSSAVFYSAAQASSDVGPLRGTTSDAEETMLKDLHPPVEVSIWAKLLRWFRSL